MPAPSHRIPSRPVELPSARPVSARLSWARLCKPLLLGGACSCYLRSCRAGVRAARETRCEPAGSGAAERGLRTGSAPVGAPRVPHGAAWAGPDRTERDGTRLQRCVRGLRRLSAQPSHLTRSRGSFVEPAAPCVRSATRADSSAAPAAPRSPPSPGPEPQLGAGLFPPGGRLLACPVRFNTIPRRLGSPFSVLVLRWVDLDGGRAPWEEPVGVASRRQGASAPSGSRAEWLPAVPSQTEPAASPP